MLTPKQKFQRLLIALAQVKAGNISENLLNEIKQIMYSLERMNKKQFLLCKKLFGHINHHQLMNTVYTTFLLFIKHY